MDGLHYHGAGFRFTFLLRFQSMSLGFVEALFEFSRSCWTYITKSNELISNEHKTEEVKLYKFPEHVIIQAFDIKIGKLNRGG